MIKLNMLARSAGLAALLAVSAGQALAEGKHDRAKEAMAAAQAKIDSIHITGSAGDAPRLYAEAQGRLRAAHESLEAGHKEQSIRQANEAQTLADQALARIAANNQADAAAASAQADANAQQAQQAQADAADANARAASAEQAAAAAQADAAAARAAPPVIVQQPAPTTTVTTETTKSAAVATTTRRAAPKRVVHRSTTVKRPVTTEKTTTTVTTGN